MCMREHRVCTYVHKGPSHSGLCVHREYITFQGESFCVLYMALIICVYMDTLLIHMCESVTDVYKHM